METTNQILGVETLFEARSTTIARDLKLNLKRVLEDSALAAEEGLLALLATASSVEHAGLSAFARERLRERGFASEQIEEAAESAAIMAMLNTYYRFRHMLGESEDYRNAGLRMTSLAKPALGKERFEMLAFAVSVLNGCESCIRSHERVLREAGIGVDKIHDLARLAAVVKALRTLEAA